MSDIDVPDEVLRALLAVPLDEFVAQRDQLARKARSEGRRDEAASIKAVRKPPRVIWELLRAARERPPAAQAYAAASADLRKAQRSADRESLRASTRAMRDAIAELVDDAPTTTLEAEMAEILRVLAADERAVGDLVEGRLREIPEQGGFVLPDESVASRLATQHADDAGKARARKAAEDKVATAESRVERARAEVESLEAQLERARRALEKSEADLAEARDQLTGD